MAHCTLCASLDGLCWVDLTLFHCQIHSKAAVALPSSAGQGKENMMKD